MKVIELIRILQELSPKQQEMFDVWICSTPNCNPNSHTGVTAKGITVHPAWDYPDHITIRGE